MILGIQIQSLVFLLSLCESLHPTIIWQRCVGFFPMVLSPIGFLRFSHETVRFLLRYLCELDFSNSRKRFQTQIWDPGENGSDCQEYRIETRLWSDLSLIFDDERPLDFSERVLVDLYSSNMEHSLFYSDGRTNIKNAEDDIISNILDFDPWDESLTSRHNFAKLLGQSAHRANILEHNEQSRFSFARHEESNNQAYGNKSYGIYGQLSRDQPHQEFGVNRDMYQDKLGSQRRLPNDRRETLLEPSSILISTKKQDRELSTTTTSSFFLIKVMPKAFWSLSSKLLANNKYVKEGQI